MRSPSSVSGRKLELKFMKLTDALSSMQNQIETIQEEVREIPMRIWQSVECQTKKTSGQAQRILVQAAVTALVDAILATTNEQLDSSIHGVSKVGSCKLYRDRIPPYTNNLPTKPTGDHSEADKLSETLPANKSTIFTHLADTQPLASNEQATQWTPGTSQLRSPSSRCTLFLDILSTATALVDLSNPIYPHTNSTAAMQPLQLVAGHSEPSKDRNEMEHSVGLTRNYEVMESPSRIVCVKEESLDRMIVSLSLPQDAQYSMELDSFSQFTKTPQSTSDDASVSSNVKLDSIEDGMSGKLRRSRRRCGIDACANFARVRGLCTRHGGRRYCSEKYCSNVALHLGKCVKHGGIRPCNFLGCTRAVQSRGRCKTHGGDVRCIAEGCTKGAITFGLCRGHGGSVYCKLEDCVKISTNRGYCARHAAIFSATPS